jgi:hypothetical protein
MGQAITKRRRLKIWFLLPVLLAPIWSASADSRTVDFAGRKAEHLESKRVEKQVWSQPERSAFQNKTFPIKAWDKHFSTLGRKRASISVDEKQAKKRFEAKVLDRKTVPLEISRWNERMADLYKRAGIQMDDQARIAADRKLYSMMMQETRPYAELAEELSLRDINHFQFRRNRPEGEIPSQPAGSGADRQRSR